jgi:hypothetical protein
MYVVDTTIVIMFGREKEIVMDQCRFPWWQQQQREMDGWIDRYKIMDGRRDEFMFDDF